MSVFVSYLRRAPVRDHAGRAIGVLKDLVVLQGPSLPEIQGIVVKRPRDFVYVPLHEVEHVERADLRLKLDLDQIPPAPPPEDHLFLLRDLLDAQVVDTTGAKVVRVNDIVLTPKGDHLLVSGLDIGPWGLMRRMGWAAAFAWLIRTLKLKIPEGIVSWDKVAPFDKDPTMVQLTVSQDKLVRMHPADLADVIEEMGYQQRHRLYEELSDAQLADLIEESDPDMQTSILQELEPERAADVLEEMEPDEAADLLGDLPDEEAQSLIGLMTPDEAAEVRQLLTYEEDTAGAMMTTSYLAVDEGLRVEDAIGWFRSHEPDVEIVAYFYLTNTEEKLSGVVSVRRILLAEPHAHMKDLSPPNLYYAHVHTPRREVTELISRYNLSALPVVDATHRLVGAISVHDVLEQFLEREEE